MIAAVTAVVTTDTVLTVVTTTTTTPTATATATTTATTTTTMTRFIDSLRKHVLAFSKGALCACCTFRSVTTPPRETLAAATDPGRPAAQGRK